MCSENPKSLDTPLSRFQERSLSPSPSPPASGSIKNASSDCEESSSFSTSSQGNTSTTLRDSNSNGSNGGMNSSSRGQSSDQDLEKQDQVHKAVFDKVVLDAVQRNHIRTKHIRNQEDDTGSDSSSGTQDCPLPLNPEVISRAEETRIPAVGPKNSSSDTGISSEQGDQPFGSLLGKSNWNSLDPTVKSFKYGARPHANLKRAFSRAQDKHRNGDLSSSSSGSDEEKERKRKRFFRTFTALRECGLMEITMQTASLMEKNRQLQKQIASLRRETAITYNQMLKISKGNPAFREQPQTAQVMQNLQEILSWIKQPTTSPSGSTADTLDATE